MRVEGSMDGYSGGGAAQTQLLPDGYQAQAVYDFRDPSGRFSYEFSNVYGPPRPLDRRGATCQLDQDLSYWSVTGQIEEGDVHPVRRAVSYAQARRACGGRLAFHDFASEMYMRSKLSTLL